MKPQHFRPVSLLVRFYSEVFVALGCIQAEFFEKPLSFIEGRALMSMNLFDFIRRSAVAVARGFDRWMTAKDTSVVEPKDQWIEAFHEANRTNIDPYGNLKRPGTVWGGPYGDI